MWGVRHCKTLRLWPLDTFHAVEILCNSAPHMYTVHIWTHSKDTVSVSWSAHFCLLEDALAVKSAMEDVFV